MNTFKEHLYNNELDTLVKLCEEAEDSGDHQKLYTKISNLAVYAMFTDNRLGDFELYMNYMQYINDAIKNTEQ